MPHHRLLAPLVALALLPATAGAQQSQTTTIVGVGSVRAKADTAHLTLRVHRRGRDQAGVREFVNRRTGRLFDRLRGIGLDQTGIQSSGVELEQVRIRSGGRRRRHLRYHGTDTVTVHTQQLELVGKVFDAALAARVTDFGALTWLLEDPTAAREEATRRASRDARQRAEAAASELGMRVTGVQSFDVDGYGGGHPVTAGAPAPAASKAPTTVATGSTRVEARVRVVFTLERAS